MMKSTNKGFTLIELLVVIAIIGILSGIAIFGLSDARQKGQDAAIIAALGQIPAQAAIYFDDNNTYASASCTAGMFAATQNAGKAVADAEAVVAGATNATCEGSATSFAVSVTLVSTTTAYCVDSEGFTGYGTVDTGNAVCQ